MARSEAYDRHPEHRVEIDPEPHRVRVSWRGEPVAESERARCVLESRYAPVYYVPREDVRMGLFEPSAHTTHCPFKGDATYYSLHRNGEVLENVAWSYEEPFDQVAGIRGHLAFHADRVSIEADR